MYDHADGIADARAATSLAMQEMLTTAAAVHHRSATGQEL
jgi:hypothetical protein